MTVKRRRATPRRRKAPQQGTQWWTWATDTLLRRSGHRCERCGEPLDNHTERHHRQRRQVGGDRLSNILILHSRCHAYITEHPTEAMANGWIVTTHGPGGVAPEPGTVPVRLPGLTGAAWWLLHDNGTKTPLP